MTTSGYGLPRCGRCGQPYERRDARQTRCDPCQDIVTQQIAADARRRVDRFRRPVDLTGGIRP